MRHKTLSRRHFGMLMMGGCAYALGGAPLSAMARPQIRDGLPRSTPERHGLSSDTVLAFLDDVQSAGLELHSFMLMRHGDVLAEGWWWPYAPKRIHMTHSATKSVTAAAVGLAMADGLFGIDDKVVSFFPQYVPADASANLHAMTVRDLLTMQTGHAVETSGSVWRPIDTSWVAEFMRIPVAHQPGTFFKYTSAASYMLSAIISRTTGQSTEAYLRPRLFDPMGISRWAWDSSPGGISTGANGLSWQTSAMLKFAALHAQDGMWNGQRLLPADWVKAATTRQSVGDTTGAYGYQWWMGPGSAYYALGLFTQLAIVFPEHGVSLAIFGAIKGSSKLKPLIWKYFPASFGAAPLPRSAATGLLAHRTADLRLLPSLKRSPSPREKLLRGRRFKMAPNDQNVDWVSFDFHGGRCDYRMADDHGEHRITAGLSDYVEQDTSMTGARLHHEYRPDRLRVVAGARWLSDNQLELTWQFVESVFRDRVVCTFDGDSVSIDRSVNINSAETSLPRLQGQRI